MSLPLELHGRSSKTIKHEYSLAFVQPSFKPEGTTTHISTFERGESFWCASEHDSLAYRLENGPRPFAIIQPVCPADVHRPVLLINTNA